MGQAKFIGRIGVLAVTLGVGAALGSMPAVAYADPGTSSSTSSSSPRSSSEPSQQRARVSTGQRAENEHAERRRDRRDSDTEAPASPRRAAQARVHETSDDAAEASNVDARARKQGRDKVAADAPAVPSVGQSLVTNNATAPESAAEPTAMADSTTQTVAAVTTSTTARPVQRRAPRSAPTRERTTLAGALSGLVSALLSPAAAPGKGVPMHAPVMLAAMGAVRDELERNAQRRLGSVVPQQANVLAIDDSPNVLLIGVDGANLSRILTNPAMVNFFDLMAGSTTAASSIVGHTTISNPSWTSVLTGVWGERTGVINNVFTPWTYNKWPRVFTLIESQNPAVQTTSIANWNVISAIADAGTVGADLVININQVPGDTNWLLTDDAVGQATAAAILGADPDVPNFVFSYFVGVDENGHLYGGASEQYRLALENFDRNLGDILDAIATSGQDWTILMVTDHGHQPQVGFGHGFQSPDETSTFVLAYNPLLFTSGAMNLQYQIADVTPTVLALLNLGTAGDFDGQSLLDRGGTVVPVGADPDAALRQALLDAIDNYGYPDIGTQIALGARTIFGAIPYYVQQLTSTATSGLQAIADMEIFLVSLLAKVAITPVQLLGDVLYIATNIVAQIVARLTGVTGASIFPLWPPAPPPTEFTSPSDMRVAAICASRSTAVLLCGPAGVAA
ncbi:alkaline phosphatase family protein [Mycobacterium sp. SMC-4]|uniref:alkaline phosphatase family protein n=1 Tax=Mycobacterium sp. SMC-4 TaxID=2857059 RepID=UPI0021B3B689|nr:alkaline phosphatase family protein [Mycobacterium sp. SMC-4]UXA20450.1 alkaline phosphatase family protein [Mycobacterium sp. SMC-4]